MLLLVPSFSCIADSLGLVVRNLTEDHIHVYMVIEEFESLHDPEATIVWDQTVVKVGPNSLDHGGIKKLSGPYTGPFTDRAYLKVVFSTGKPDLLAEFTIAELGASGFEISVSDQKIELGPIGHQAPFYRNLTQTALADSNSRPGN